MFGCCYTQGGDNPADCRRAPARLTGPWQADTKQGRFGNRCKTPMPPRTNTSDIGQGLAMLQESHGPRHILERETQVTQIHLLREKFGLENTAEGNTVCGVV